MKKWILQLGLIGVLGAVALLLRGKELLPQKPEDTIAAFFDAARDGNMGAYLRLTSGELRKSLDQLRRQQGAETFQANLRRTNDGIVGQAVRELPGAPGGMADYEVELVFADRNEVQRFRLEQVGSGWAIASIETARVYQPEIPYGTPVFAEPEEAKGTVRE
ncbi:MAG: hypothetical protein GXX96_29670 [Planctomycetaceae bacterium]|nr:hypothetical protein [Planctomycetaceae bacterium]